MPNGIIQKPSTGRNPMIPPSTNATPVTIRNKLHLDYFGKRSFAHFAM